MRRGWVVFLALVLAGLVSCSNKVKKDHWENGNLKSELRYEGDELNGLCVWYFPNGKPQMEVNYSHNKMDGRLRRWYENGNLMEECWYKAGVQDSVSLNYSLNGILLGKAYYKDGKLNGDYRRWYENGQVFQEGQYVEDLMDGSWMVFYSDGNLAATALFDKGTGTQTSYEHSG